MLCSPRCRCPRAFRWRPWPSAKPAPPMPASSRRRSSAAKTQRSRPNWRKPKRKWPPASKGATASSRVKDKKAETFSAAIAALKSSGVVVFPPETLYGLGADALDPVAVEKVYRLKGRDPANPIPVLVADRDMLDRLVVEIPPLAGRLIDRFWPGPLTLVLPARKGIPRPLLNASGGVGVRISSQSMASELVRRLGRPLTEIGRAHG